MVVQSWGRISLALPLNPCKIEVSNNTQAARLRQRGQDMNTLKIQLKALYYVKAYKLRHWLFAWNVDNDGDIV